MWLMLGGGSGNWRESVHSKGNMNQAWTRFLPAFVKIRLEGRHDLQQLIGNTGWLFADKILRMGVGLVVSVWVARYLGPQQIGLLNYVTSFVALFSVLTTLGLDGIVVRELINHPEEKQEILGSTLLLKFWGAILTVLLSVVAMALLRKGEPAVFWLVAIIAAGTVFQTFDAMDFWFQSQVQSKYTVWAKNSAFLLFAAIKVFLILQQAPLMAFALAATGELVVGAVALVVAYTLKGESLLNVRARWSRCRSLLRNSWPLLLSALSVIIYMKIDQVMLGQMVDDAAVGVYGAAAKVSEIWYFIPMMVVSSVLPTLLEARKSDEAFYYRRLRRLFRLMSALAFSIALPMTFLSTPIITFLYGEKFAAAGTVLAVHIWAAVFVFLGVVQSAWDLAENYTRLSMMRTTGGAVLNIALNYFLIPRYAALGAAIATVISYAFSSYVLNLASEKTRKIFVFQTKSMLFLSGD